MLLLTVAPSSVPGLHSGVAQQELRRVLAQPAVRPTEHHRLIDNIRDSEGQEGSDLHVPVHEWVLRGQEGSQDPVLDKLGHYLTELNGDRVQELE